VIYSIRIADIPKFIIGFIISAAGIGGLISLWKFTGGMPVWFFYSLFVGLMVASFVAAHFIWKAACNAWKRKKGKRLL